MQCQNTATHRQCRKLWKPNRFHSLNGGDQNIVKGAQMQRQVQMTQKMPSEIRSGVQNMLMPGSSEAAVQSPGPVLWISSRRQTSLYSRLVQCCRSRADELEMRERAHEGSDVPWSTREQANARETQGRRSQEASPEAATEFRDVGTPAQPCKRHSSATAQQRNNARDTAKQEERSQQIAPVIENFAPFAEAMTKRSWRTRYLISYCCPEFEAAMKTITS